ncbi:type I-G CRISPR-associated helicase/endonuclease Cas3g [Almyronema epifaneia]|uniref:CRISPR-associated helicase Cas3 n=1 Tax=Almyronema epifaneia S1 TaxID=2991925 RepID=A0ABW6IKP0_9CYAN
MTDFAEWFHSITGNFPFPYQANLANRPTLPLFLDAPTGVGKTAAIALGWLWRRHKADTSIRRQTPRRLLYCLPMRTLVEQTYSEIANWLEKAELNEVVGLHLLMGGAVSQDWDALPDKDCILVGTQDQLLSRALNRGYSMSRYRWPIHFALLNNDCLWVMDETQLMGAGLQTTAQLQGFREKLKTYGSTQSLWMSATLDRDLLRTVDYEPDSDSILTLDKQDFASALMQRLEAKKPLQKAQTDWSGDSKPESYAKSVAEEVISAHISGKLTLVVCNRVDRAQAIYKALNKFDLPRLLIHSRFRPLDRAALNCQLKNHQGILIATQAVEAGVDIDAAVLFTELAPWSSLVQRFGRCNRRGEQNQVAQVYWIDTPDLKKKGAASPYEAEPLTAARSLLESLTDVGYQALNQLRLQNKIPKEQPEGLIPRRHDLLQLFDTSTDLAGHDIDVSSFIREIDNNDVLIAWRSWPQTETPNPPDSMTSLQQDELCRVSLYRAKDFINKLAKQTPKHFGWAWDGMQEAWVKAQSIYPGMSLLLHCEAGGYSNDIGFTGDPKDQTTDVEKDSETLANQLDADSRDPLTSTGAFITLQKHAQDVAEAVQKLCNSLSIYDFASDRPNLVSLLERTGRWHDLGKAHEAFQSMLTQHAPERKDELWAKTDRSNNRMASSRRGFRHELVSALVALQEGEDFLLAYLVACHHGKVRMTIQPRPTERPPKDVPRYALGVWEGDSVPPVDLGNGVTIAEQKLSLACMQLGESEQMQSWTAQAIALLEEFGPFKLAFLESLIRLADWQVSKRYNEEAQSGEVRNA